jgi:nucleotide-binding universal stress UspA family protein
MVIIAAVNRSDQADDVLDEAYALAGAFDEPIHVVHVLSRSEFIELGTTQAEKGDFVDMDDVKDVAQDIAAKAASHLKCSSEAVGLVGKPPVQVVDYAADHNARYIVVGGRKRSPTGKLIFGSFTQSILLNAECPVLSTIK